MDSDELARTRLVQAGVFTRRQALACGIDPRTATRAIAQGAWAPVAGRGYVRNGHPIGADQAAWAAALSAPGAVVWGPTALKLWRPDAPLPRLGVAVVARPGPKLQLPRVVVRRLDVPAGQRAERFGLTTQVEAAALVDSLAWLAPGHADSLFAWAVARDAITLDCFNELAAERAGQRNCRRLAAYGEMLAAGAGSSAELLFHTVMRLGGVSGWRANSQIRLPEGLVLRVDVLIDATKTVGEVDGWLWHSSKEAFQSDRSRQNALTAAGYRILRFTWEDLTRRPDYCVDQMRRWTTA
ncbi:MAG: type IV toxin-antitoxin system AbiEi family antitoxin domain-containing protein [Bifidobacteriaceae bacterium]|jgi:very-short-patch-repair endonuclease|nr:type IV toxin-antitoxin system AbiEi family antitoxin domain-containing protein [Bifidobacteriaceae bacterium]